MMRNKMRKIRESHRHLIIPKIKSILETENQMALIRKMFNLHQRLPILRENQMASIKEIIKFYLKMEIFRRENQMALIREIIKPHQSLENHLTNNQIL